MCLPRENRSDFPRPGVDRAQKKERFPATRIIVGRGKKKEKKLPERVRDRPWKLFDINDLRAASAVPKGAKGAPGCHLAT